MQIQLQSPQARRTLIVVVVALTLTTAFWTRSLSHDHVTPSASVIVYAATPSPVLM